MKKGNKIVKTLKKDAITESGGMVLVEPANATNYDTDAIIDHIVGGTGAAGKENESAPSRETKAQAWLTHQVNVFTDAAVEQHFGWLPYSEQIDVLNYLLEHIGKQPGLTQQLYNRLCCIPGGFPHYLLKQW